MASGSRAAANATCVDRRAVPALQGGKCGGKGCADGPGHTRKLLGKYKPYDDKKVFCHKNKGKKVTSDSPSWRILS
jgi:hypothetical protein